MRKMRKQPMGVRNDWYPDYEPGDRVYRWLEYEKSALMYDLVESRGRNKAAAGELTPILVKKDKGPRLAIVKDGIWYWAD